MGRKLLLFHANKATKKNLEYVGFFTVDDRSNQLCDPISGQHAIWNLFKEMAPISLIRRGPTIPLVLFSW